MECDTGFTGGSGAGFAVAVDGAHQGSVDCHSGNPLTRPSIARASGGGEGRFMSRRKMFVRTGPPASRHILATARSTGMERRNPEVAQCGAMVSQRVKGAAAAAAVVEGESGGCTPDS